MPHKNQSYEKTRTDLTDAFLRLYQKNSPLKISVADVCREAGYHRSTFYHHFKGLEDIADKLRHELMAESSREFFQTVADGTEQTNNLLFVQKDAFQKYSALLSRMLFVEQLDNYVENYLEQMTAQIKGRIGDNAELSESRLNLILTYALAGNVAVYNYWKQHQDGLSEAETIELLEQLANKGVRGLLFPEQGSEKSSARGDDQ